MVALQADTAPELEQNGFQPPLARAGHPVQDPTCIARMVTLTQDVSWFASKLKLVCLSYLEVEYWATSGDSWKPSDLVMIVNTKRLLPWSYRNCSLHGGDNTYVSSQASMVTSVLIAPSCVSSLKIRSDLQSRMSFFVSQRGTTFFRVTCLLLWKWLEVFGTWQEKKWEGTWFLLVMSHLIKIYWTFY